jgi:aryl-alcohol dehydrogenase-like predicted oxidoreductase
MKKRKLGYTDEYVSPVGLGCMGMSGIYGPADDESGLKTLHRALELGCNFWDTADVYGLGHNEELVGKALKGKRDEVFLCTKFALTALSNQPGLSINGRPEYVRTAIDKSLQRLGVDHVDLYYQHRVDKTVPIEETVGAMAELVQAGKVRYLGLSEASSETLRRAVKVHPIAALQSEYSLWSLDVEDEILATIRELGIGLVAYSPVGRGFLTGAIKSPEDLPENDWRRSSPRFQGENFYKNLALVDKVKEIADAKGCTASQLALAWLLHQGDDIIPIPGTKRIGFLEENVKAADVQLSAAELQQLRDLMPRDEVAGARYPERGMATVNG